MDLDPTPAPETRRLTDDEAAAEAHRLLVEAYRDQTGGVPTAWRDTSTVPPVGDTPPVPQPGRPPMSQRATDHAALVATYSLGSLPVGAATSLTLWTLATVPPPILALIAAAPPALAISIGVAARMIGRGVADGASALPEQTVHQHYGPTHVEHTQLHTRTWLGRTTNRISSGP